MQCRSLPFPNRSAFSRPLAWPTIRFAYALCIAALVLGGCARRQVLEQKRTPPTLAELTRQCNEAIGAARVEEPAPGVFVAVGYDLANAILVRTEAGNVVIDAGMSPARSAVMKEALLARSPGPIRALIYTHSHIDHVGGAAVWIEEGTEIWATEAFRPHFLKQYALFQPAEMRRGAGQFGEHVSDTLLPCSALGRRVDLEAARESGARMPTHTFSGATKLTIGGVDFELHEAHGETHDQLFVWLPQQRALLPGDNFYHSFPNIYTIRGTSERPVDQWIDGLDRMRSLEPAALVPSHTRPVTGTAVIGRMLTDYRDAIQWVRDETVRGANRGEPVDALAAKVKLPAHLVEQPYLAEMYGQLDWSVRGIYGSNLGWFDGRPETLYPLAADTAARREVELMGGAGNVEAAADSALAEGDERWGIHLLAKLRDARFGEDEDRARVARKLGAAYYSLAEKVFNTNGRGYLFESAFEAENPSAKSAPPKLDDELLAEVPVETFFRVMAVRLKPEEAGGVHETLAVSFSDSETYRITVRRGVAEVKRGDPLPGTPPPVVTLRTDTMTWKKLALKIDSPAFALAAGRLSIDGGIGDLLTFLGRFDQDL